MMLEQQRPASRPVERASGLRAYLASSLPGLDTLDRLTYQIIAFGFPLLTLTIISGAIWAQAAWGRWWGWDPKESASLVAWLVYAAYLHGRIQRGWQGAPAAAFALLGFLAILFCYIGVNFLPGLHSYGTPSGTLKNLGGYHGVGSVEALLSKGYLLVLLGAMLAYIVHTVTRNRFFGLTGTGLLWLSFLGLTGVLVVRTINAGRLPLTGYDFTLCFVWGIILAYLVAEWKLKVRTLGMFVMPVILAISMYGYLFFPMKGSKLLMPALQNQFWLHVHVLVAMLAYGALALSFATAVMYFLKRKLDAAPAPRPSTEAPHDDRSFQEETAKG